MKFRYWLKVKLEVVVSREVQLIERNTVVSTRGSQKLGGKKHSSTSTLKTQGYGQGKSKMYFYFMLISNT